MSPIILFGGWEKVDFGDVNNYNDVMKGEVRICRICGHDWQSKVAKPRVCPRCKRYDYDEIKETKTDEHRSIRDSGRPEGTTREQG